MKADNMKQHLVTRKQFMYQFAVDSKWNPGLMTVTIPCASYISVNEGEHGLTGFLRVFAW